MAERRSLAGIILIFLFIIGDIITGVASTHTPLQKQSGIATCTWASLTTQSCGGSVVFPTAFTGTPTISFVNIGSYPVSRQLLGAPQFITASTMWVGMPAATTEFLGNTNSRLNFSNVFQGNLILHARVLTGDASATAALQLQKDTDGTGNTWSNVVGATLTFGTGIGDFFSVISSPQSPTMTNGIEFRIVGSGGDGVSSPVFQYIYFEVLRTNTIGTIFFTTPISTGFSYTITLVGFPTTLATDAFQWIAEQP